MQTDRKLLSPVGVEGNLDPQNKFQKSDSDSFEIESIGGIDNCPFDGLDDLNKKAKQGSNLAKKGKNPWKKDVK